MHWWRCDNTRFITHVLSLQVRDLLLTPALSCFT
jgi:hypothetical protein